MTLIELPTYQQTFDQVFTIEPLAGPMPPRSYLDRFPDALYHKGPESHLVRLLYTFLGPAGVAWLRKESLQARLKFEAQGLDLFDWDEFYGDPLSFGRILEEEWTEDTSGLLTKDEWDLIRSKDLQYRSRALDFINGARAGNTPYGMTLVARSGLGQNASIIENYKYLFDIHSDEPLSLLHLGRTLVPNEMVVVPHYDVVQAEQQQVTITGSPTGGTFVLWFKGQNTTALPYNVTSFALQSALEALPSIGVGNVEVTGGPVSWLVQFSGLLDRQNLPELTTDVAFSGGSSPDVAIQTITDGVAPASGSIDVSARAAHTLQTAMDRIKPVTTIPTLAKGQALRRLVDWLQAVSSSEFNQVQRYVKGQPSISWPSPTSTLWIQPDQENPAPIVQGDLQYHYVGFHNVHEITASSVHIGQFSLLQKQAPGFGYLAEVTDDILELTPDRALADYAEPLTVTTQTNDQDTHLINGIYPTDYLALPDAPPLEYHEEDFWASQEAAEGDEWLEVDLGETSAVNFVTMEISRKPIDVGIELDTLNLGTVRRYSPVTPGDVFTSTVEFDGTPNPWYYAEFQFTDRLRQVPLTRWLKLNFTRRTGTFLYDPITQTQNPWSIEVRNLRIGRSVTNF
jgi:hypothetical protein